MDGTRKLCFNFFIQREKSHEWYFNAAVVWSVLCMLYNDAVEMFYSLLAPHNSQESLCGYPSGIYTLLKKCTGSTFCLYIQYFIVLLRRMGVSLCAMRVFLLKIFTFIPMFFLSFLTVEG